MTCDSLPDISSHPAGCTGRLKGSDEAPRTLEDLVYLVNIQKTMERSTIFHGEIHYFYGDEHRYVKNFQRVSTTFVNTKYDTLWQGQPSQCMIRMVMVLGRSDVEILD